MEKEGKPNKGKHRKLLDIIE